MKSGNLEKMEVSAESIANLAYIEPFGKNLFCYYSDAARDCMIGIELKEANF